MTSRPLSGLPGVLRQLQRAIGSVLLLIGLFGMHALGPIAAPVVMGSSHAAAAMPFLGSGAAMGYPIALERPHAACAHEHCVAALRPTARASAPHLLTSVSEKIGTSATSSVSRSGARLRAPPQSVSLDLVCVSRT